MRAFYDPTIEMYRGLGNTYAEDPRFAAYYDAFAPGLAIFMKDAIKEYCDEKTDENVTLLSVVEKRENEQGETVSHADAWT